MTRLILFFAFSLLLIPFCKTGAQSSSISISYLKTERSKDSHSISELFSLEGKALSYSVKQTGRGGPYPNNNNKTCVLTDENFKQLWTVIAEKRLNENDSLINNSSLQPPYSSESIDITVMKNGKVTSISVKGESSWLSGKPIYKNSEYLIAVVRNMLAKCK